MMWRRCGLVGAAVLLAGLGAAAGAPVPEKFELA
jgi:hypothetical protein